MAFKHRPLNELLHYNGLDTVATARVFNEMLLEPEWNTERVQRLWDIHVRLAKIAARMHSRGFFVNATERARLSEQLLRMHEERKSILLRAVDDKEFGASPDDMRALIYRRHAIVGRRSFNLEDPPEYKQEMWTDDTFTKCAVSKPALLQLYVDIGKPPELRDIIRKYWECHAPRKAKNTYVDGETVQNAIGADGRLRPGWNSCGTETMRWSCSSPNLMNLSEEKDADELNGYLPNMRVMYEAGEGMALVHADASQQELRFNVPITGDTALEEALYGSKEYLVEDKPGGPIKVKKGDVYSYDTDQVFGLRDGEVVKFNARKQLKIIHLAFQYAAGTPAVYTQALIRDRSITYSKVKLFHNKLKEIYWRTCKYWETELKKVSDCGYSEGLLLGTRVYYPSPPAITETANKPIQTTAAESMAIAMCRIEDRLAKECPSAYFVNILHDAFDIEAAEGDVGKVKAIMKEEMEGPWHLTNGKSVKVPVDIKAAKSWGKV
jgi:DNA polymerase I-like protein with 3'-5' exonuclease and polymerase domains